MDKIIILDFGSQYNQLIARRIRELGVYSEVHPYTLDLNTIKGNTDVKGIILSGGPGSVYDKDAYLIDKALFDLGVPILGICYGMQLIHHMLYGEIEASDKREYGKTNVEIDNATPLTKDMPKEQVVWMSHGDRLQRIAPGFRIIGSSDHAIALTCHDKRNIYTMQFHPEVTHTECGKTYLSNFVLHICQAHKDWQMKDVVNSMIAQIRKEVGFESVILALSGGVDSSVCARLIHQAIGKQLTCVFVDTGLMREDEGDKVMALYHEHFKMNVVRMNAQKDFFKALKGIEDPEKKRKIIGKEFIRVFESAKTMYEEASILAQGTIYPDVIESISVSGPSHTIKSHHNVGGLPDKLGFSLLEPLRYLFKDEVREIGLLLGIPHGMIFRHPFPGPGLGIRIIGEVTPASVALLQKVDTIFIDELNANNLYHQVSQAFAVLLPVKTVGVAGDKRTYEQVCVLRSVDTTDFMTANVSRFSYDFLEKVATRILNEVKGINRVTYDITSKPPGTIEWE